MYTFTTSDDLNFTTTNRCTHCFAQPGEQCTTSSGKPAKKMHNGRSIGPVETETTTAQKEHVMTATIRDLREQKNLSQDKVAEAAGLTYSKFVRIEEGSGKTTPEEVAQVLSVLEGMEPGTRRLAGRPFKDPVKQAAVKAARERGESVAAALGLAAPAASTSTPAPAPEKDEEAPAKPKRVRKPKADGGVAAALSKKAPARSRSRKPKADPSTSAITSLLPNL